jgi:rare lipoprotein A
MAPYEHDSGPGQPVDVSQVREPIPRQEPRSRYGNPEFYEVMGKRYYVMDSAQGFVQQGLASWYGKKFHGRRTSSGEPYNMYALTAAHKTLPLPSYVRVKNLDNGRELVVKVNDRGPFHAGRIIDLSYAAAVRLGFADKGVARVEIAVLDPARPEADDVAEQPPQTATKESTSPYLIQIGAFADAERAKSAAMKVLRRFQQISHVSALQQDGQLIYRVRIGPFAHRRQANEWLVKLEKAGFTGARLVTRDDKWKDI